MSIPRLLGSMSPAAPEAPPGELIVLLPSLGTTTELWDGVVPRLQAASPAARILRIDLPGHGASPAARDPFTMSDLASAVLRVVDEVGGGRFHLAGDSLGGAVALEVAVSAPERVVSLALFASGARIGDATGWAERAAGVRAFGTASLVEGSVRRWFAPGHLDRNPDGAGARALRTILDVDDESYALCCLALADFDRTADTAALTMPVLLAAGEHDGVTTSASMRALADALPGARFVELAGTAHLPPLEAPAEAAALLTELIGTTSTVTGDASARGMAVRRAVLGDAHVDRAISATTPETAAFQDFITRYAWGEVWARPDLSRRERSIATLASLVTGGHEAEIRMHVGAGLRNGLTPTEIAEVILHTALYAGLPAANAALAIARDVFASVAEPVEAPADAEENHG